MRCSEVFRSGNSIENCAFMCVYIVYLHRGLWLLPHKIEQNINPFIIDVDRFGELSMRDLVQIGLRKSVDSECFQQSGFEEDEEKTIPKPISVKIKIDETMSNCDYIACGRIERKCLGNWYRSINALVSTRNDL